MSKEITIVLDRAQIQDMRIQDDSALHESFERVKLTVPYSILQDTGERFCGGEIVLYEKIDCGQSPTWFTLPEKFCGLIKELHAYAEQKILELEGLE